MAVQIRADQVLVVFMGNGVRVLGAQHLVHRLTLVNVTVQTIGDPFAQIISRLAVKGLAVRIARPGSQVVTLHDFRIVVAAGAYLGHVAGIANLVQPGRDMIVKSVDKFILFVAYPAAPGGGLGDAGPHRLEK